MAGGIPGLVQPGNAPRHPRRPRNLFPLIFYLISKKTHLCMSFPASGMPPVFHRSLFLTLVVMHLGWTCRTARQTHSSATQPSASTVDTTCRTHPQPDCACIQVYEPVCGCDGRTYGNACLARCAGIRQWTPGECPNPNTDKPQPE